MDLCEQLAAFGKFVWGGEVAGAAVSDNDRGWQGDVEELVECTQDRLWLWKGSSDGLRIGLLTWVPCICGKPSMYRAHGCVDPARAERNSLAMRRVDQHNAPGMISLYSRAPVRRVVDLQHVGIRVSRLLEGFRAEHALLVLVWTAVPRVEVFLGDMIHHRGSISTMCPERYPCTHELLLGASWTSSI